MNTLPEKPSFGDTLRFFRGRTIDKRMGKPLSQGNLGARLSKLIGLNISRNVVSNWENGKSHPAPHADRHLLVGIVTVLYSHKGIQTLKEANQLLTAGGFSVLNDEELISVEPDWAGSEDERNIPNQDNPKPDQHQKSLLNILGKLFFAVLEQVPEWLLTQNKTSNRLQKSNEIFLVDPDCGNQPIDLKNQRLKISEAFGSYFTGLLEKQHSYTPILGQIELSLPNNASKLDGFQQIYWSMQYTHGPDALLIAAEGGMGKSTLATKIIRCLYADNAIDLLLGDSAKSQIANPITGEVEAQDAAFDDLDSFLSRVSSQLGLDYALHHSNHRQAIRKIKDRIEGRRTVIVLDNLESVHNSAELFETFRSLSGRDTRLIVTTRRVSGISHQTPGVFLIRLKPISNEKAAKSFLNWHIKTHASFHRDLTKLSPSLEDKGKIAYLLRKTGGIPLLMQLVLSDIARTSWERLDKLPSLFGKDLLNFLYQEHWNELDVLGSRGLNAQEMLFYIAKQSRHKQITYKNLLNWANETREIESIDESLNILQERFLILNNDIDRGNFSIFPSLAEFLELQK